MSGLVVFFRSFLPESEVPRTEPLEDDSKRRRQQFFEKCENNNEKTYGISLSSVLVKSESKSNGSNNDGKNHSTDTVRNENTVDSSVGGGGGGNVKRNTDGSHSHKTAQDIDCADNVRTKTCTTTESLFQINDGIPFTQNSQPDDNGSQDSNDLDNNKFEEKTSVQRNRESMNDCNSTSLSTKKPEMTQEEWKKKCVTSLENFMTRRMLRSPSHSSQYDTTDSEDTHSIPGDGYDSDEDEGGDEGEDDEEESLADCYKDSNSDSSIDSCCSNQGLHENGNNCLPTTRDSSAEKKSDQPQSKYFQKKLQGDCKGGSDNDDSDSKVPDNAMFEEPTFHTQPGTSQQMQYSQDIFYAEKNDSSKKQSNHNLDLNSPAVSQKQSDEPCNNITITSQHLDRGNPETKNKDKQQVQRRQRPLQQKKRKKQEIPHIDHATNEINSICDIDLETKLLTLDLCRVNLVWGLRHTKRMTWQDYSPLPTKVEDNDNRCGSSNNKRLGKNLARERRREHDKMKETKTNNLSLMETYRSWESDGPLGSVYKTVLSMELMELDDGNDDFDDGGIDEMNTLAKKVVRKVVTAAFTTKDTNKKSTPPFLGKKNRPPKKRVRLFLYNKFAVSMSKILENYRDNTSKNSNPNPTLNTEDILISLRNIPAKCILPFTPPREELSTTLLQGDYGRLARYCICVGNKSNMYINNLVCSDGIDVATGIDRCKVYFDDGLEIRISRTPSPLKKSPDQDKGGRDEETKEYVLSREMLSTNMQMEVNKFADNNSRMASQYLDVLKKLKKRQQKRMLAFEEISDGGYHVNEDIDYGNNLHYSSSLGTSLSTSLNPHKVTTSSSDMTRKSSSCVEKRVRPMTKYLKFSDIPPLLASNEKKRQKNGYGYYSKGTDLVINVYGAVLGFTSPSFTKNGDWMITVTLIDESTPVLEEVSTGTDENSKSISRITMIIFSTDKKALPRISCAGDILRAHRVVAQEWNDEVQLIGRKWSSFVIVRPTLKSIKTGISDCENDWEVAELPLKTSPDYSRAKELWEWAQIRLTTFATVNKSVQVTISQIDVRDKSKQDEEMASRKIGGDWTVMIAGIIPTHADHRSKNFCPRGLIRAWDGTGPPISDPLPGDLFYSTQPNMHGEPPPKALSKIEDITDMFRGRRKDGVPENISQLYEGRVDKSSSLLEPPRSLCGRVVNIVIWEQSHWDLITGGNPFIGVGHFIRLRNVHSAHWKTENIPCLMVHAKSSLTPLPNWTNEIRSLLIHHNARIMRKEPFNPSSGCLPLANHNDIIEDGVMEDNVTETSGVAQDANVVPASDENFASIIECLEVPAPASFAIRFHVENTIPPMDVTSMNENGLRGLCIQNIKGSAGTNLGEDNIFQFAMQVRDPTGEIDVIVSNKVAESLFGLSASEVCSGQSSKNWSKKHKTAIHQLSELMRKTNLSEGKIRSILLDGTKYFVLDSIENGIEAATIYPK